MFSSYVQRGIVILALLAAVGFAASYFEGGKRQTAQASVDPPTAATAEIPAPPTPTPPVEQIAWSTSFNTALKQAKAADKLIILDFYTDWCGYCKKLDAEVYPDAAVVQIVKNMVPVKLNAEKEGKEVAARYRDYIGGFPTILFINGRGEVEEKIGGYQPAPEFAESLNAIQKQHLELPKLEAKSRSNPQDAAAAVALVSWYTRLGRTDAAVEALERLQKADPADKQSANALANNSVGAMFERKHDAVRPIPFLEQALKTARTPADKGFSHLNLALCLLTQKKLDGAKRHLNLALAVPDLPDEMHQKAQELLTEMSQNKTAQSR